MEFPDVFNGILCCSASPLVQRFTYKTHTTQMKSDVAAVEGRLRGPGDQYLDTQCLPAPKT
jgi:hypothetical protein